MARIKRRAWLLAGTFCFALATLLAARPSFAAPIDPARCGLRAFATKDNDIRVEDDYRSKGAPIRLPPVVAHQIHAAVAKAMARADPELFDEVTCSGLFGPIYRVTGFGRRQLFVDEAHGSVGWSVFVLVLYDPDTDDATMDPPLVGSRWMNDLKWSGLLVKPPIISASNLLGGPDPDVVVQERVHNGTVYNGVVYHYYDVGPGLSLTPVLALETRVLDLLDYRRQDIRTVRTLAPNRLRMDLYTVGGHRGRRWLGESTLGRGGPGRAFHVLSRHAARGANSKGLVTFCDSTKSEDYFLRHGCDDYY